MKIEDVPKLKIGQILYTYEEKLNADGHIFYETKEIKFNSIQYYRSITTGGTEMKVNGISALGSGIDADIVYINKSEFIDAIRRKYEEIIKFYQNRMDNFNRSYIVEK